MRLSSRCAMPLCVLIALAGCSAQEPFSNEGATDAQPRPISQVEESASDKGVAESARMAPTPDKSAPAASPLTEVPTATTQAKVTEAAQRLDAAEAASASAVAPQVKPPASFAICASCHAIEKGAADRLGPNLFGIMGKDAAQGSFAYSDALRNAGLRWTDATMDKWLANPREVVPGNKMPFPGVSDAAKRREIIEYLRNQR